MANLFRTPLGSVHTLTSELASISFSIYNTRIIFYLVVIPLIIYVIVRLTLYWLKHTARITMIQVKKIRDCVSENHFLDLKPDFVEAMRNHPRYGKVMSLASYLGSLDYGDDENVAYRIVSTLVASLAGESVMPLIPLVPASMIPKKQAIQTTGLITRFTFGEFPSILTLAALVDGATRLTAQVAAADENVPLPKDTVDALDLLALGEAPTTKPDIPPTIFQNDSIRLNSVESLRAIVEREVKMDRPDSKRYEFPKPFAPDLLPGLCRGHGGLEMTVTPRMYVQNRLLTIIMNKLASNFASWAEYGPFRNSAGGAAMAAANGEGEQQPSNLPQPYPEFKVYVGDEPDSEPIFTCGEFLHQLVKQGGGTFRACVRTNLTSFGIALCVLDEPGPPDEEDDPYDEKRRHRYTHIPLAFCCRTGLVSPFDGTPVHQLSTHHGIEWHFTDNKFLGPGEVVVTFYTGIEGFTGFKPGGEWDRPWVIGSDNIRELTYEEAISAADLSACESVCSNVCVRVWKFPFGGYGGLGVCGDSVAVIEHALRGRTTIFPLFMRGDAKNGLLYVIHEHLRVRLLDRLMSLDVGSDPRCPIIQDFLDTMNRIARTLSQLPNDIQVEPHEVMDALDRVHATTMNSPFHGDQYERGRLKAIKDGWTKTLMEFATDFEGYTRIHRLSRSKSEWRL